MPILSRVGTGLFLKSAGGGGGDSPAGEAVFHADSGNGTTDTWNQQTQYSWTVPDDVTSISVVCVGGGGSGQPDHDGASGSGGGLAYKNNITVTPGETVTVVVGGGGFEQNWGGNYGMNGKHSYIEYDGTIYAQGGGGKGADKTQANGFINNQTNGIPSGDHDGGGNGGSGVAWNGCRQSGGGAGGYNSGGLTSSGTPGNPQYSGWSPSSGSEGGGGGGCSANGSSAYYVAGGGGTGIYGKGTNGPAAASTNSPADELAYTGKGGSSDPWSYETNGLTVNSYDHYSGLRGYSVTSPWNQWANESGGDLSAGSYRRDQNNYGYGVTRPDGGFPGGGAGGGNGGHPAGAGGNGVVRIVWGTINGMTREFPNQGVNKTDEYPGLGGNTPTKYGTQRMC